MKSRARRRDRHPLFDQPNAQADFGYCAKLDYWTPEEGAALSFGYSPRFVSSKTVEPYLKVSSKADEFDRRLVLILRAVDANSLKQQFTPADFVTWADRVRLEFPKRLRKAITTIGSPAQASQEEFEGLRKQKALLESQLDECKAANREAHPRERRSLYILIAGMAAGKYGFNPSADRNSATKAIVDDIELLGLSIDKDTVLAHLRRAVRDLGIKLEP